MSRETWTYVLAIGLAATLVLLGISARSAHLPGVYQGYAPEQPIAFSHRLHAGELGIDCQYCHGGVEESRHAGIPPTSTCMNCHKFVNATLGAVRAEEELAGLEGRDPQRVVSSELSKIYRAMGLNDQLEDDPALPAEGIAWTKVHHLADFVYFDHSAHVNAGIDCATCHGPVEAMDRVRQVETLSMSWCVNCHRDATASGIQGRPVHASTDCTVCHY